MSSPAIPAEAPVSALEPLAPPPPPTPRRRLGRTSAGISTLASFGVLAGFLVDATIAALFGAGARTDAFFVASTIPFVMASILLASANQALVPLIGRWFKEEGEAVAERRVGGLFGSTLLLAAGVAAVGIALSRIIPYVLAPGSSDATKSLAGELTALLFVTVVTTSGTEVMRAAMNARFSFVPPALTPVVENLSVFAVVIVFGRSVGVVAIAIGYVVGGVLQLGFLLVIAARRGLRVVPRWGFSDAAVRRAFRLVALPVGTTGLSMAARAVERFLASFLPAGSITILNYGWVIVNSLSGAVFFRSVVVALLPSLAEADDGAPQRRILAQGTRIMTLVSFPLTALTWVLALPLVAFAFQRGAFTGSSARVLAALLALYAIQLPLSGLTRVFLSYFYARLDMVTPFANGAIGVGIDIVLAVVLFRPLGIRGLAVAYGFASLGNVVHAYVKVRRATGFDARPLLGEMARVALASVVAGAVAAMALGLLPVSTAFLVRATRLAVPGVLGLAALVASLFALRVHKLSEVATFLRRRPA
jgi:putative peptidoglycan lipid II flippase